MSITNSSLPVAVLGAGPVGMAAAAHLLQRGLSPIVLEAGKSVASNLASYRHVRLFSPWQYNIDRAARDLLSKAGWTGPDPDAMPTAGEVIDDYLQPLAALPQMAAAVRFEHRVTRLTRHGIDKVKTAGREHAPFVIRVDTPDGEQEVMAQAVIDATGTWSQPNPLGANGLPALGERLLASRITYGMPDILGAERTRYAGKRILVVGAGHSAAGNLIALAILAEQVPGTHVIWALRGDNLTTVFGGGESDQLPARGLLGIRLKQLQQSGMLEVHRNFRIHSLRPASERMEVLGEPVNGSVPVIDRVDEIIAATGARPDLDISRELRLRLDPWLESTDALASLIDPNLHSCGTVRPHGHRELAHPESGYYAVGAKSYGRAPNFLMATGYEQVRSIAAALVGELADADDVQLELPETGVCNTRPMPKKALPAADADAGCCGGPAPDNVDACCVLDAEEKEKGAAGCGCGSTGPQAAKEPAAACCG